MAPSVHVVATGFTVMMVVALLYAAAVQAANDERVKQEALLLTKENFNNTVKQHKVMMVMFMSNWCESCSEFGPAYQEAAKRLKANNPPIYLAEVNCGLESSMCQRFGIPGYPYYAIYRDGKFSTGYGGARDADSIVALMKRHSGRRR